MEIHTTFVENKLISHLTSKALTYYKAMQVDELIGGKWTNPQDPSCPNVLGLIDHFNFITGMVIQLILNETSVRNRAILLSGKLSNSFVSLQFVNFLLMSDYIEIIMMGQGFKEKGNLQSLQATLIGLQSAPISRLQYTWKRLPQNTTNVFNELLNIMSLDKNFANYREYLNTVPFKTPLIPYLGIVLSNLTGAEENKTFLKPEKENGAVLINFSKQRILWNITNDFLKWRVNPFPETETQEDEMVRSFLLTIPTGLNDKQMYEISLTLEPRGALENQIK